MMAISPDFNADAHSDLPDILQTARRQVSIMSIHTQMDYENQVKKKKKEKEDLLYYKKVTNV